MTLHKDWQNFLWIGSNGSGLIKFDPETKTFTNYNKSAGLKGSAVYGILEDENGHLWISTNKGLSKFNPLTETFTNYDVNDGLQSNEFNGGARYKRPAGEMFFGGINGFNRFYPSQIIDNTQKPPVVFTDFKIFNNSVPIRDDKSATSSPLFKSITETDSISISYKDRVFSFEFAALHFIIPQKNEYAYMMEGLENLWNYVGNRRFVSYTNLKPGDYIFRVKASNNDGIWNNRGAALKIKITPPFWWTRGAIIAYIILFIISFVGGPIVVHKYRVRNIKARREELEKIVEERTSQLNNLNIAEQELAQDTRHGVMTIIKQAFIQAKKLIKIKKSFIVFYNARKRIIRFCLNIEEGEGINGVFYKKSKYKMNSLEEKIIEEIIQTQKPILVKKRKTFNKWCKEKVQDIGMPDMSSFMGVPIVVRGKVLGIFVIFDQKYEQKFDEHDLKLISTLASQTAITLDNAILFKQIQRITKTYPSISELGRNIDSVLKNIIEIASKVLESDVTVIYQYDQKNEKIIVPPIYSGEIYHERYMSEEVGKLELPYRFINSGKNHFANNSKNDKTMLPEIEPRSGIPERFIFREKIVSSAGLLLKVSKEIVGILFINFRTHHEFDEQEKKIIELCSSYIATAIQSVRHFREKEITDASRTLGEITGRFAHTMKNKFQSMGLFIDGLLKLCDQKDNNYFPINELRKILDGLIININNLLELSKLKVHEKRKTSVRAIIKEFKSDVSSNLEMYNIKLLLDIKNRLPRLYVDPRQIKIVFLNLVDNSMFYMEKGGKIKISVFREKDTLFIVWTDTGPGIQNELAEKIFEIGYTTSAKGYGLGLFHSRAILEEYGGNISVDSKFKKGAKFIIRFPIK